MKQRSLIPPVISLNSIVTIGLVLSVAGTSLLGPELKTNPRLGDDQLATNSLLPNRVRINDLCAVSPGCEGDVNRASPDAPGPGDGILDGDDLIWYDRFANGMSCLGTGPYPVNEFQRADVAPLRTGGDGALGLDRAVLGMLVAGFAPSRAAVGPLAPNDPFCVESTGDEIVLKAAPISPSERALRISYVEAPRNAFVAVPVEAAFGGGEISTQFTIHFDPSALSISDIAGTGANPDVLLGDTLPAGTTVTVNTSSLATGDLGVVVYFNGSGGFPEVTAPPGTRTVVTLRFRTGTEMKTGAGIPLTFNDTVFLSKMSDTLGGRLPLDGGLNGGFVAIRSSPIH